MLWSIHRTRKARSSGRYGPDTTRDRLRDGSKKKRHRALCPNGRRKCPSHDSQGPGPGSRRVAFNAACPISRANRPASPLCTQVADAMRRAGALCNPRATCFGGYTGRLGPVCSHPTVYRIGSGRGNPGGFLRLFPKTLYGENHTALKQPRAAKVRGGRAERILRVRHEANYSWSGGGSTNLR
jgi:hypothetical protein